MALSKKAEAKKAAVEALEKAKAMFKASNEKFQAKRQEVSKARRTIATGNKRIVTLEKKIEETKDAPSKAAELLIKKSEEMDRKTAEMDAEQEGIISKAKEIDGKLAEKTEEFEDAKKTANEEMEAMGIPKMSTTTTRTPTTGTTAERRAKNNFQYRLKSKDWNLTYNTKGRIESAEKFGLEVVFNPETFVVTGNGMDEFSHPYGEGSLTALANVVKEPGTDLEA